MSESTPINVQAFQPFNGGGGALLSVSSVSSSVLVPGSEALTDPAKARLLISGDDGVTVCIRMGQQGVVATLASLRIRAGTDVLLMPPFIGQGGVWVAGICASGLTATIQITAGQGT